MTSGRRVVREVNGGSMSFNPYQPVETAPESLPDDATSGASFVMTKKMLRHGEEQFLLRMNIGRLTVGSVLMILISLYAIAVSVSAGGGVFLVAVLGSMGVSTLVYWALIRNRKRVVRDTLPKFGLTIGADIRVRSDRDGFFLATPTGSYDWPNDAIDSAVTGDGLLVMLTPACFVFVSKKAVFEDESFRSFRDRVLRRTGGRKPRLEFLRTA